jgi:hypothetical protein
MSEKIEWTLNVQVVRRAKVSVSRTMTVEACAKIEAMI